MTLKFYSKVKRGASVKNAKNDESDINFYKLLFVLERGRAGICFEEAAELIGACKTKVSCNFFYRAGAELQSAFGFRYQLVNDDLFGTDAVLPANIGKLSTGDAQLGGEKGDVMGRTIFPANQREEVLVEAAVIGCD